MDPDGFSDLDALIAAGRFSTPAAQPDVDAASLADALDTYNAAAQGGQPQAFGDPFDAAPSPGAISNRRLAK